MKAEKVVIRKYGNRRLYDTSGSRYINLEDLASLIRNGTDVQIVDASSGADLTGATLTQIIAESAKDKPSGLPLELLRQLIVTTDHAGQEFISWYLKSAVDTYQQVQASLKEKLGQVGSAAMSPLQAMGNLLQSHAPEKSANEDASRATLEKEKAELEARYEALLKATKTKNPPAGASAPRKPVKRKTKKKR